MTTKLIISIVIFEQYWANVEARAFRFQDDSNSSTDNGFDPPPKTDQALLQRLPEEEETAILGKSSGEAKMELSGEKHMDPAPQNCAGFKVPQKGGR